MPSVHLCSLHINQHWTPQKSKLATGVILKLKLKEATGTSVLEPHVIWICLSLRLHCTAFCLDPSSDSVHFCGFFLWQTVCSPVCWGAAYPCTFCMNLALEDCIYKYIYLFLPWRRLLLGPEISLEYTSAKLVWHCTVKKGSLILCNRDGTVAIRQIHDFLLLLSVATSIIYKAPFRLQTRQVPEFSTT